jgi:hypothetical protein
VNAARDSLNRTATLPRAGALRFLAADWLVDRFRLGQNAAIGQDLPTSVHAAIVEVRIHPTMRVTGAARDVSHLAPTAGQLGFSCGSVSGMAWQGTAYRAEASELVLRKFIESRGGSD